MSAATRSINAIGARAIYAGVWREDALSCEMIFPLRCHARDGYEGEPSMQQTTMRILAVDDELDFLDLFVKRLKKRGLDVDSVDNGYDALAFLAEHQVDVVVLDVKMPRIDGIETLKEIKKRFPLVEVIMLTGHGSVESGLQGMSHGAYDYVMKPFSLDDLIFKISKAYERRVLQLQEAKKQ